MRHFKNQMTLDHIFCVTGITTTQPMGTKVYYVNFLWRVYHLLSKIKA